MLNLLHIDGSDFFKKAICRSVREFGINCTGVKNDSREVFELLENSKIDLILTALSFEDMDGIEFIKKLVESDYSHIPVIVISSADSIELRLELFSLGVIDFIPKEQDLEKKLHAYFSRLKREDDLKRTIREMPIAVLDDSETQITTMKHILEINSIENVDYFTKPNELLESNRQHQIYLIDVVLPGISGEQMVLTLREKNPSAVIMAISGIDNYKVVANILVSGADDYILKPYNATIFMARLRANARNHLLMKELETANRRLQIESITDGLTQLYNHKYMFNSLEREIERSKRQGGKLSFILLDIDHFKKINDTFGHPTGDAVLRKVAFTLKRSFRQIDTIARYGGEEFAVIMPETSSDQALVAIERLRKNLASLTFGKLDIKVTLSGGLYEYKGETAAEVISLADELLYRAKKAGRNRVFS